MAQFQVGPGTVVHVSYRLFDADDSLVESSDPELPLSFLFGYGQVAPALEEALAGARVGDVREMTLPPERAFGVRDVQAILELDADEFPPGTGVGDEFDAEDEAGDSVCLRVVDVADGRVWVDTNHPLAGQHIRLELTVDGVRAGSGAELAEAEEALAQQSEAPSPLLSVDSLLRGG